jgi:1-acyl-sn-glycerol-3-phosphate acyltransferase
MKRLAEKLSFYLGFTFGGIWFLVCSFLGSLWLLVAPRNRQTLYVFGKVFCHSLVRMMGWKIEVENRARMEEQRPCVIVANHQSFLDVVTFGSVFPRRTVSAGKREIGKIPVFGWFYRLSGNLIIDRDRARAAHHSLEEAAKTVRDERVSLWFMPEGHRNRSSHLLPFKTGAFRLAIAAGVPIVPVVAEPLDVIVDTNRHLARPGTLRIRVLDPIGTQGLAGRDLPDLVASTRSRMQQALEEMSGAGHRAIG